MKGIVFTEFIELVESRFSIPLAEQLLETTDLPSGGVYTSVGTYDSAEMVALVTRLSAITGTPVPDLLKEFGKHMFGRFLEKFPAFFDGVRSAPDFLEQVDGHVHVEVRKLYPDAELPGFQCERPTPERMEMTYRSRRNMPDLAEGLIRACYAHFGQAVAIERRAVPGDPNAVLFALTSSPASPDG
jgi:hypothetical protein